MTLRTRILLGYGYLIGLLLLSVSVAAINSQRVAGNSKQVLERNIQNLTQAITMVEQLERQDSETLLALLQPTAGTRLDDAERAFEGALTSADDLSKVHIDDEDRPTLATLRANFEEYRKVRAELLSRVYEDPLEAAEDYRGATQKALLLLKAELNDYVARKTESLKQANDEASRSAVEGAVLLGVMVTVALLSLGFLSRSLQRDVLGRLTEVGHVTEAIAAGDRRRRVRDFYQDELGLVARQLNAALDRQQELESQMQGRLLEQRRVLVGLMNQWPTPAGMIGIDGEIVASTLNADDETELHRLTPRVRAAAGVLMTRRFVKADELSVDIKASDGRRTVKIRALASGDNQIAGWLASFIDPDHPELSGVFPVAREPSGVYPISHEPSGVMPLPREASGIYPAPLAHESGVMSMAHSMPGMSHSLAGAEASGVRPVSRHSSGALSMARSGPQRAATREANEERDAAASEAALAVNVAMLADPELPLADAPEPRAKIPEALAASAPQHDHAAKAGVDPLDRLLAGPLWVDPRDADLAAAPAVLTGSDAVAAFPGPDEPITSAADPRLALDTAPPPPQPSGPPVVWSPNTAPPQAGLEALTGPAGTSSPSSPVATPTIAPPALPTFAPPALPTIAPPAMLQPPVIARPRAPESAPPVTSSRDPDETT